jgi:hypothetical protein
MTNVKQDVLFAGLPRRRRLAGIVTIGLWLGLAVAFISDAVPTRSSVDWLYGVEARRDAHARALAARAAAERPPVARRAARTLPAPEDEHRPITMVRAAVIPSHTPAVDCALR